MTNLKQKSKLEACALETLGVTTDKCGSILYPMVESFFSDDFLKAWNRNNTSGAPTEAKERLNNLMPFLKTEVEGEERIYLAMKGFGLRKDEDKKTLRVKKQDLEIS
ncbi:endonuclease [Caerostris extrusa]|uniref:Endonuclease n=1 Tax=Caerostris extrusa TaxID=172846 RepID=A0AAV4MTG7_CAEEX|nr:endonuclease [Caerostris extrusa]